MYRHTQLGYVLVFGLLASIVGVSIGFRQAHVPTVFMLGLLLPAACALIFPTLTTDVTHARILCFFGVGLVRREIALREIAAASVVRNSWATGWGLRKIPGGWLWNVSGLDAVELTLRDGKRFQIGTDEPQALYAAITKALTPQR